MAAKYAVTSLAGDQIDRGRQVATADVNKVKEDTINALKQLQGSVLNSLTETETYALGQCLKQCQSQAKAMLAAYKASLQASNMEDTSADTVMGGNRKKRKSKNTYRKGNKKYSKTKKYRM